MFPRMVWVGTDLKDHQVLNPKCHPSYRGSQRTLQRVSVTAETRGTERTGGTGSQGKQQDVPNTQPVCWCDRGDTAAGRSDTQHGYTITLPQRLHQGKSAPAQQSSGNTRDFLWVQSWVPIAEAGWFPPAPPSAVSGLTCVKLETPTAAPITQSAHATPSPAGCGGQCTTRAAAHKAPPQCPPMSWPLHWPSFSQPRMPFPSKEPWPRLESSPFKPT